MPAGPSEVAVFADESANPRFVASDLLSQAEHGPDSQVLLVTGSGKIAGEVKKQIREQLKRLPRMKIAVQALNKSRIVLVKNESEAIEILNAYAPEHLILNSKNAGEMAEKVINAGSVFIGPYSPESVGDYASGTNHTLPTNGFAKAYSGLSLDSFRKKISFQQLSKEGLEGISIAVEMMAEAEGLRAHAEAVRVRLEK
jgi:histidinol dehydrogenase